MSQHYVCSKTDGWKKRREKMPKVVWINHDLAKSDWKKQNSFFQSYQQPLQFWFMKCKLNRLLHDNHRPLFSFQTVILRNCGEQAVLCGWSRQTSCRTTSFTLSNKENLQRTRHGKENGLICPLTRATTHRLPKIDKREN